MRGRRALVTGAARGIGRAVAELLRDQGATVLTPTRDELDLRSDASIDGWCARLAEPVDILVNNAGVNPLGAAEDFKDSDLAETVQVNLLAPMRLARALTPAMARRGWGRVVNVSSIWSGVAKPRRFVYATTKAGVIGLTKSVAADFIKQNIRCNAICPGTVQTPSLDQRIAAQGGTPEARKAFVDRQPLGRLGSPEEIAAVAVYLASDESSFTTGTTMIADGGYSL